MTEEELHERFGKLAFAELLAPTIEYATVGVPITQETADIFKEMEEDIQQEDNSTFKKVYFINKLCLSQLKRLLAILFYLL